MRVPLPLPSPCRRTQKTGHRLVPHDIAVVPDWPQGVDDALLRWATDGTANSPFNGPWLPHGYHAATVSCGLLRGKISRNMAYFGLFRISAGRGCIKRC